MRYIFLDIETTGMNPSVDHIIEIACIKWQDGEILERFESLAHPCCPIPFEIVNLTGIDDEAVANAPRFAEIKDKIVEFIEDAPIVGHNIAFDTSFLKSHHVDLNNPEIDTVALARILLLKEHSYALQVLMKKYGLPMKESHRAMADTESALEFFKFLLGKIRELPDKVFEEILAALEKSDWAGKEVFKGATGDGYFLHARSNSPSRSAQNRQPAREKILLRTELKTRVQKTYRPLSPEHFWQEKVITDFLAGKKILLESSSNIPFAELKKEPLLIAYNSLRKRDQILSQAKAAGLTAAVLKEPNFYLSPKKLNKKLAQKNLPIDQTPFLLKMIIWNTQTDTGDREEITLEREEYGLFELIADNEGADKFWEKAHNEAIKRNIILVHQYGLARGLDADISANRSLIIAEASYLEESFTNAFRKRLTLSSLRPIFGEKAVMFFGMLGIFYDRFMEIDQGGYHSNVILNEETRASVEWQRVLDTFANLPEHPQKNEILQTFLPQENVIKWVQSYLDEISFHGAPLLLAKLFAQSTKTFQKIILQSEALSGDGSFNLMRELFELDSEWKQIKEERIASNLDLKIPNNIPAPFSNGYFKKCNDLFLKIIAEKKGKALFILSSKKTVSAVYSELLPQVKDTNLLAVGPSGGTGKSLALFKENPENSVLIATNQILPFLSEIEDSIDTIVFQKIPFDPPGDLLLSSRAQRFDNGFTGYTLPRAITRFREILAQLGQTENPKTCYLLDSRLLTKDYGRMFI